MFDKDAIKKELIEGSNIILKRYDEKDVIKTISIMNTKGHVIFLGSLRVYNEGNVKNIENALEDCFEDFKYHALLDEIDAANVPEAEKQLLRLLAARFIVFRFNRIAEYYAHSGEEVKGLFRRLVAVQIDYEEAIQNGVVKLYEDLQEIADKGL